MASRTLTEVVGLLQTQLRLLQKYRHEAFDEGNNDYLGEVAGKLRLLVSDEEATRRCFFGS